LHGECAEVPQGYDVGIEKLKEADTRTWVDMYKREGYREVDVSEVFRKILASAGVALDLGRLHDRSALHRVVSR